MAPKKAAAKKPAKTTEKKKGQVPQVESGPNDEDAFTRFHEEDRRLEEEDKPLGEHPEDLKEKEEEERYEAEREVEDPPPCNHTFGPPVFPHH